MTLRTCLLLTLAAMGCRTDPTEESFYENVGSAFDECRPGEVKFLAAKHNFMAAFEPCGSNNFKDFAWSPDGAWLYFQLPQTHHIMHAAVPTKNTSAVPTDPATAPAAWLDSNRIAIPVAPLEGTTDPRIQVFDKTQMTVRPYTLTGLSEVTDLVGTPNALYFTAMKDGTRQVLKMQTDDGAISAPFPWTAPLRDITSFHYEPANGSVVIGSPRGVTLYDAETGESRGTWGHATRGAVQPSGTWLALEYEGEAINLFYQRAWDELPERARERERRRADAFVETLPPWYQTEVRPPRISVVNLANQDRFDFTGFMGDHFEWYAADDNYVSYVLWGFEGKQMNTNVMLGSLADRLRAIAEGETMFGIAKWEDPDTPPPIDPPSAVPAEATGE